MPGLRTGGVLPALAMCFAVASMEPPTAHACTCPGTAYFGSDPKDGATDVPRNKAILVQGLFTADSVVLEDSAGKPVEFTSNAGETPGCSGTWIEIIPKQPLQPNTTYKIKAERNPAISGDIFPKMPTFTTGSEMLDDAEPEAPAGKASIVLNVPAQGSCDAGKATTCVGLTPSKNVEVIARRGDRMLMHWMIRSAEDWTFVFAETPDCMEFRSHSETGKRSAPLKICGDKLATREFRKSDVEPEWEELWCEDGVVGDPDAKDAPPTSRSNSGCSAAPEARSLSARWSLFALVLAAYVIRRGARTRSS